MLIAEAKAGVEVITNSAIKNSVFVNYFDAPVWPSSAAISLGLGDLQMSNCYVVNYDNSPNSSVFRPQHGEGFTTGTRLISTQFINSNNI
jgi:hypothetical protein